LGHEDVLVRIAVCRSIRRPSSRLQVMAITVPAISDGML
jgi:hypothetical protein